MGSQGLLDGRLHSACGRVLGAGFETEVERRKQRTRRRRREMDRLVGSRVLIELSRLYMGDEERRLMGRPDGRRGMSERHGK